MLKSRYSNNRTILKEITSKSRTANFPPDIQYLIIFAFVYKYCSDSLRQRFLSILENEELTLDEAYADSEYRRKFKRKAYGSCGFFIEKQDAFIDDAINRIFDSPTFLRDFFDTFTQNISFNISSKAGFYIREIFDGVREEFPFDVYDSANEHTRVLKDIIYSISKLNVFDVGFTFEDVFTSISDSRILNAHSNPEYVYQILSAVVASQNPRLENVYDPFMRDASAFSSLADASGIFENSIYGKEADRPTYLFAVARLLFGGYNLDRAFLKREDATESADINRASFDGIMTVVPIRIRNYRTSTKKQSMEIVQRNKRNQLADVLSKNFDMDITSFAEDPELNRALDKLINRMDMEADFNLQFTGEYEILNDSRFLFLINLISSLNDGGVMAISISQNFLSNESLATLRKYLTFEKNYIDAVINIPADFAGRKRPETVIVFRKNRKNDDVMFIDMSRNFKTTRGRINVPGRFRGNVLLSDESIDEMIHALINRLDVDKYSKVVHMAEIASKNYNLSVSKYVDTFEGDFISLRSLEKEKRELDLKREELDVKIDMLMRELNIK